jgi:hypothetical protein
MSKPCSKCKGEMSMNIHEPFHGEEGGLKLTVRDMPYVACAQGHKRFVNVAFAAELLDLLRSPETFRDIPAATKKGFFKKSYLCPDCARELPDLPTGHQTQELVAELDKAQPFKVVVQIPVYKCGGCSKEHIRSAEETGTLAFKATDHAYRSIDIHPN